MNDEQFLHLVSKQWADHCHQMVSGVKKGGREGGREGVKKGGRKGGRESKFM